jgi:hypothetical protein
MLAPLTREIKQGDQTIKGTMQTGLVQWEASGKTTDVKKLGRFVLRWPRTRLFVA